MHPLLIDQTENPIASARGMLASLWFGIRSSCQAVDGSSTLGLSRDADPAPRLLTKRDKAIDGIEVIMESQMREI
jgi:hypothetical protein